MTAHDEYAVKAFEVHAIDYLLKPFNRRRFDDAVARIRLQLRHSRRESKARFLDWLRQTTANGNCLDRLVVKTNGRILLLHTSQIEWIEAQGDYVLLHAGKDRFLIRDSMQAIETIPVSSVAERRPQMLGNLAQVNLQAEPAVISHYNVQPMINVYASVNGRDLGSVSDEVAKRVSNIEPQLPKGSHIVIRGQVQTMKNSFEGLALGLVGAIVLVYLLIVVNFQSWLDPFIIITALPGALAGICWMLLVTRTTLSVPSLTGAIMSVGVATSNSILMVSFAREQLNEGKNARDAALEAGFVRMRPVIMTALALIIGMVPMAIGLGEGGEQNAPLGRAVIGGLLFATFATLFFVPCVFSIIHGRRERRRDDGGTPETSLATA